MVRPWDSSPNSPETKLFAEIKAREEATRQQSGGARQEVPHHNRELADADRAARDFDSPDFEVKDNRRIDRPVAQIAYARIDHSRGPILGRPVALVDMAKQVNTRLHLLQSSQ